MITEKKKLLILMATCEIPNKKQEQILETMEDFGEDLDVEKVLRDKNFEQMLSTEEFHKILKTYDRRTLNSMVENLEKQNYKILTTDDSEYPSRLLDLPERPLILFAKGDLSLTNQTSVAIVGTRMPSNYGKIVTARFAEDLARAGFVIISGLCYGVDEISHRKTLEVGGKTIAVIASGFNNIYPAENTNLAKEIAENGLILSEYPPSFKSKRYTFPKRNRIVAGLSDGVLITEASMNSGTKHTKEYALEYGKDIFAVPGNITSNKSELTNFIIKSGQAQCVTDAEDIISYYGMEKRAKKQQVISLNFEEQLIVDALKDGEKDFDFLTEKTQIPVNILNSYLTTLEIRGLIRKLPSQVYALV